MFDHPPVLKSGAMAMMLACGALIAAGNASAKVFQASATVPDFRFDPDREEVIYSTPALGQMTWEFTESNELVITSIDEAEVRNGLDEGSSVVGRLNLTGNRQGETYHGELQYTIFGTLTSSDAASTTELVTGSLDAMQSSSDDQSFTFLFSGGPATGSAGSLYQSVGIYAVVYGTSESDWLAQHNSDPLQHTFSAQRDDPSGAGAAPLPATPLLLLAGLAGLRWVRRQA